MKKKEKEEAIALRSEGLSLGVIANRLNVSKSSVSVWVRDVELTKKQQQKLIMPNRKNKEHFSKMREQYQEEGREKAKERDIDHAIGCMLYWAEGTKSRNVVTMTNSDLNLHKAFLKFLKIFFEISNEDISIAVNCYLDHDIDIDKIYEYWIKELEIKGCRIHKATIRDPLNSRYNGNRKKSKLKYGVLKVNVCSTSIVQRIYGSIQEYCNFDNKKWIS